MIAPFETKELPSKAVKMAEAIEVGLSRCIPLRDPLSLKHVCLGSKRQHLPCPITLRRTPSLIPPPLAGEGRVGEGRRPRNSGRASFEAPPAQGRGRTSG